MATVYKITNLKTNLIYVGATTRDLNYRMALHKHSAFTLKSGSQLYKAMRRYGFKNFTIKSIEECSELNLLIREEYWIKELNTMHPNGYNTESSHLRGAIQSDIVKKKKSIAQLERFSDESERKRHSRTMKRMFKDEDVKERHRQGIIDSWTDERREQYSELGKSNHNLINAKGYLKSAEVCSKAVEIFDNETKEVKEYSSAKEACRELGFSESTVSQSIYRKSFIKSRYLAKYKKDKTTFNQLIIEIETDLSERHLKLCAQRQGRVPGNIRPVLLTDVKTGKELEFKTVNDAALFLKRQTTNISHACKVKGRTVGGYYAKYI